MKKHQYGKKISKGGSGKRGGNRHLFIMKKGDAYLIAYRIQTLTGRTCINIEFYEQMSWYDGLA